jgi:DNA-binding response OmpR family regulator
MKNWVLIVGVESSTQAIRESVPRGCESMIVSSIDPIIRGGRVARPSVSIFLVGCLDEESIGQVAALKERFRPPVPIIVLSSENSLEAERHLRAVGVFYYLIQPHDPAQLRQLVRAAIQHSPRSE